ncbi:hypothetical protein BS78_05G047700 [Paspalum vaginatum]|nr:hypothetical protein BS78_05G047700 [Paspalum vaginatum]
MEEPHEDHRAAVKNIVKYIAGTKNWGLFYPRKNGEDNGNELLGYSDSDMAGDLDGRKSTSGVLFFLGKCPISWQSMKQKVVALSSCEAEYIAAATAACQAVWLARLLAEIKNSGTSRPLLRVDNKSAISLIKNPVHHDRSKHIDVRFHLIREYENSGQIEVKFISTQEQLGDILTKPLGKVKFQELCTKIGLHSVTKRDRVHLCSRELREFVFNCRTSPAIKVIRALASSDIRQGGLAVLPIVGSGGVGKTTLTQHIYNDARVERHFSGSKFWICVSNKFDLVRLTHEMLDYVTEEEHARVTDLNKLQEMLRRNMHGRRFLLVLDDVWDTEDKWDLLLEPLKCNQAVGSFVIVTTRSQSISRLVSTVGTFNLDPLKRNDFWLLFKSYACGDEKYHMPRKLKAIGRQIANKMKGNPLAVKTVDNEDWKSLECTDGIMPALKLSYSHLPCYLQQCFYWCALFPKDHRFHEVELVELCISLGFVCDKQPGKRLDEIGSQYIADLVNFGFHQYERNSVCYIMHDLMHDLACLVSENECVTLDGSGNKQIIPGIRHLSILGSPHRSDYQLLVERIEKQLCKQRAVGKLRTLLLIGVCNCWFLRLFQNIFREAQRLRLVLLTGSIICSDRVCRDLDYSISNILHPCHLRFLNLGAAGKRRSQRQDVSRFYSLQVLDGSYEVDCKNLRNIVNLGHLGRNQWAHASIPYVGKLTFLQELENFKVQNTAGFDIGQLERMNELVVLRVSHLENIESETEALRARLADKIHLDVLSLSWHDSGVISGLSSPASAQGVLEALEPHPNLKHLRIAGYMGVMSPRWLAANLSNCKEWLTPPSLGKMPLLKKLTLIRMHAFKEVLIPYLDELVLIQMSKLETCFCQDGQQLPSCLRTLHIEECSKLNECFHNLHRLILRNYPHVTVSCPAATVYNTCYVNIKGSSEPQGIYKNVGGPGLISDELRMQDDRILSSGIKKWMQDDKILPLGNQKSISDDKILPFGNHKSISDDKTLLSGYQKWRSVQMRECPNLKPLALSETTIEDCPDFLSPHVTSDANANYEPGLTTVCFVFPYLKRLKIGRCGITGRSISQILSHAQSMFMLHLIDYPNVKLLQVICPLKKEDGNNLASSSGCLAAALTAPDDFVLQIPTEVCSSLGDLEISNCRDLILGAGNGGLTAFPQTSMFRENRNPLPPSLETLYLDHLPAEVLLGENMSSLKRLQIWTIPELKSLQLHPSCTALEHLEIRKCSWVHFVGNNHIQRMVGLTVEQARALECLTSLTVLQIENCPNLLHLPPDIHGLPCLESIAIVNCPAISQLPEKGLPPSLTRLSADGCSQELNEQCRVAAKQKFKVQIDGEYVY